ncbi:hypothetical protein ORV05_26265 [Amycolatopsis cynarae]|uniref:Uncharacterized protein n=1 Tax=Amycolatopsis cynarae TaxID=2995223 RepID=A0ABY7AWS7_9PSEU|nr:hypothetical protein [Amycolatopsis sp. HUAS 11-8]WAL64451.1 hypothetical protein ORV05_26265 [Amycolatopsis sp. HUAS 11-8]
MSLFEVLRAYGAPALLRFVLALLAFLVLHLVRLPFVLLVLGLEAGLRATDRYATRQAGAPRCAEGVAR